MCWQIFFKPGNIKFCYNPAQRFSSYYADMRQTGTENVTGLFIQIYATFPYAFRFSR
jgi:hypothetical protein